MQQSHPKKKHEPKGLHLHNSTAEFLIFSYQTGGDGVEVRVQDAQSGLVKSKWVCCSIHHQIILVCI